MNLPFPCPSSLTQGALLIVCRLWRKRSNGRLTVNVIDPKPDSDAELTALGHSVRRIPMTSGDYFYLGATATAEQRTGKLPYFDQRRQQLLDYDIAVLLSELGRKNTRKLGILSPLVAPSELEKGRIGLSILEELKKSFDVAVVPHFSERLPDDLDVVLIIDATILKKEMLYSIDQYAMKGGGLVILMDPHLRSNKASNAVNPDPGDDAVNDLSDLLLHYGLTYNGKQIVGDSALAASVMDEAQRPSSYPFWLRLPRAQFSSTHPVSADLNEMLMAEAGSFAIKEGSGFAPLITTTETSGGLSRKPFPETNTNPARQPVPARWQGTRALWRPTLAPLPRPILLHQKARQTIWSAPARSHLYSQQPILTGSLTPIRFSRVKLRDKPYRGR